MDDLQKAIILYDSQTTTTTTTDDDKDDTDKDKKSGGSSGGGGVSLSTVRALINSAINAAKSEIAEYFDSIVERIVKAVSNLIDAVTAAVTNIINSIYKKISEIMTKIFDRVAEALKSAIQKISSFIEDIWDSVIDRITSAITKIEAFIDRVVGYIYDFIKDISDRISLYISEVVEKVEYYLDIVLTRVESVLDIVVSKFRDIADSFIDHVLKLYEYVEESVRKTYEKYMQYAENIFNSVQESVILLMNSASQTIDRALESVADIAESLGASVDKLVKQYLQTVEPHLDIISRSAISALGLIDTEENRSNIKESRDFIDAVYSDLINPDSNVITTLRDLMSKDGGNTIASKTIYMFMMFAVAGQHLANSLSIMNIPKSNKAVYEVQSQYPNTEFSVSEAVGLTAKRILTDDQGREAAAKGGYQYEKFDTLVEGASLAIDVERAISARNRGLIDDYRFEEALQRSGIRSSDIDIVTKFLDVLPPLQDIITMAVREVFNKDVADQFQLFSDLPEEFVNEARKQGLTEEWAKRYWGAHWRLPSANQGFEMFHRGFIDEETLKTLLRALDVSPFWRDKLLSIAYQPITRVDIRRFFKLGLMTRDEVVKRHMDIGYSPNDSEFMADFVEAYTGIDEEDEDIDVKTLSMSQIKRLFNLGTITHDSAVQRMIEAGYGKDTALLLVNSWLNEEEIAFRENMIARYTKKAIKEDMDLNEINALFSSLNPTTDEMSRIQQIISIERAEYDSIPSKAELKSMALDNLITYDEWFSGMRKHGYNAVWIDKYFELYQLEKVYEAQRPA